MTKYRAISPDGFDCFMDELYQTKEQAIEATKRFADNYKAQGYYSSMNGRIHFDKIAVSCQVKEVDPMVGYVDIKVTVWQRIKLSESQPLSEVIKRMENDPLGNGLFDQGMDAELITLPDTEEFVSPEENGGFNTIEIYSEDDEELWNNTNPASGQ